MPEGSNLRRQRNGDVRMQLIRKPPGYSRYTDPEIFPRFGGDEFDPPPYATDRKSIVAAPAVVGPRHGWLRDHLAIFAKGVRLLPQALFRSLNAHFMVPR